jgi:hypothetical protein
MAEIDLKSIEEAKKKIKELNLDASLNKPKPKEIKKAEKEFKLAKKEFEAKKFDIGAPKQADDIYNFVIEFMEKHVYWTKNGWMGVIRMHEELTKAKKEHKNKKCFRVGYQALEFLFYALTNPGGSGIESAREVEKVSNLYAEVIELTGKKLEESRLELKDINWLGDKAASMAQGYYIEKEDGTKEAHDKLFHAPSIEDLLSKK